MIDWVLLVLFFVSLVRCNGLYECGEHGRFEYCVDEIPGCVIGCHCHPGYYFDTETKICEPNIKQSDKFRRRYDVEPTRIHFASPEMTSIEPILTTTSVIENHVESISKNADGLSDWLYNQFFKTIENQVINNTNEQETFTRRKGGPKINNKPKRRKKTGKTTKNKKKALKQKLLRITENDSLFDSSSYSSDKSSSSSSRSSDETSAESNDDEHGHRKIVMLNKKPRPPLPSFIFLPDMNTPFYPPIGLPPPPVMPMFPVVPVPPMPMYPLPPMPNLPCNNETQSTTITTTSTASSVTTMTDNDIVKSTVQTGPAIERTNQMKNKKAKNKSFSNKEARKKLLTHLREKMKRNKQLPINSFLNPTNTDDSPLDDNVMLELPNTSAKENQGQKNVNFKYLSQLIHKSNSNKIESLPLKMYTPHENIKQENQIPSQNYFPQPPIEISRRFNKQIYQNVNKPEEAYYTKLGRQIASLIRGIDADNERQVNIEIEETNSKIFSPAFFNENSPRSFWERSVRSPVKFIRNNDEEHELLDNSNELLFDIENKVNIAASTTPKLSLQQLENIVNVMETVRNKIKLVHTQQPKISTNLGINLWPTLNKKSNKVHQTGSPQPLMFNINTGESRHYAKDMNKFSGSNHVPPNLQVGIHNFHQSAKWNGVKRNDSETSENHTYKARPIKISDITDALYLNNITQLFERNLKSARTPPIIKAVKYIAHHLNPADITNKNTNKYFSDNNYYYYPNANLPYPSEVNIMRKSIEKPRRPSFFHREVNNFEYLA